MRAQSPELNELASALCAAQAEFGAVPKDSVNPFFKSRYAGLPAVVATAAPILTKHGLSVSQFIGTDDTSGGDTLTTWLLHRSGQFICESMRLHLTKTDAQGQGSATTYARRYAYMSVVGLVADEDDDGQAAVRPAKPAAVHQQPSAKPVEVTEKPASAKQRGMLNGRAGAAELSAARFANAILVASGSEPREFGTEEEAQRFVNRALDRLPAKLVSPVLEEIARVEKAAA